MFQKFQEWQRWQHSGHQQKGGRGAGPRGRGGRGRGRGGRGRGNGKKRAHRDLSNVQCYNCNGWGHMARDCKTDGSYKEFLKFKSLSNNPNHPLHAGNANKKAKVNFCCTSINENVFCPRCDNPEVRIVSHPVCSRTMDEKDSKSCDQDHVDDLVNLASTNVNGNDSDTESCEND